MENLLPKCSCGEPVHVELVIQPFYDESGCLEGVDQDFDIWDTCYDHQVHMAYVALLPPDDDDDELPF